MFHSFDAGIYKRVRLAPAALLVFGLTGAVYAGGSASECRNVNGAKTCGPTAIRILHKGSALADDPSRGLGTGADQFPGRGASGSPADRMDSISQISGQASLPDSTGARDTDAIDEKVRRITEGNPGEKPKGLGTGAL